MMTMMLRGSTLGISILSNPRPSFSCCKRELWWKTPKWNQWYHDFYTPPLPGGRARRMCRYASRTGTGRIGIPKRCSHSSTATTHVTANSKPGAASSNTTSSSIGTTGSTNTSSSSSSSWLGQPATARMTQPMETPIWNSTITTTSHCGQVLVPKYDDLGEDEGEDEHDIQIFRKEVFRHMMGDVWSPILTQLAAKGKNEHGVATAVAADGMGDSTAACSTTKTASTATTNQWLEMAQGIDHSNTVVLTRTQVQDLLAHFDPQCPPPATANNFIKQLWLECESQLECTQNYQNFLKMAISRHQYSQLSSIQRYIRNWYTPLQEAIVKHHRPEHQKQPSLHPNSHKYYAYISAVPSEKLAILTAYEILTTTLQRGGTVPFAVLSINVGEAVEAEFHMQKLLLPKRTNTTTNPTNDDTSIGTKTTATATNGNNNDDNNNNNNAYYKESSLELFFQETLRLDPSKATNNTATASRKHLSTIQKRVKKLLHSDQDWSTIAKARVGAFLVDCFLQTATFSTSNTNLTTNRLNRLFDTKEEPAFTHEKKWINKKYLVGHVTIHPKLLKQIIDTSQGGYLSSLSSELKYQPMVYPPRLWKSRNTNNYYNMTTATNKNNQSRNKQNFQGEGSYYIVPTNLMRTKGCAPQNRALKAANLDIVLEGLNALGRVPWRIHTDILQVAQRCWRDGITLGDIPSRQDFDIPQLPERPNVKDPTVYADKESVEYKALIEEWKGFRTQIYKCRRITQKNMDLYGLRCSAMLKLNQAEKFKHCEELYFPYNLDFRGRAYPIPPHLSNIGSDLCRGLLKFSKGKPLGPRGLYWLKVHLANLAGKDKISFEERVAYTTDLIENNQIRAVAEDPFGDSTHGVGRWWMTLEDPFQALATCIEINRAIASGDPPSYLCSLPVHMDGSCNGLQHYAALGRDYVGGKAVNLCDCPVPQDVYLFVMNRVVDRITEEAATPPEVVNSENMTPLEQKAVRRHEAAKLVNGFVDRSVVKRTVMTSVYGVTYIGARKQIMEKLEEKLEAAGVDVEERADEIYAASGYLARLTMEVMGELFQGARQTMSWLAECARLISSHGQPMAWLSAIGVPVVQPYRQTKSHIIVTFLQTISLTGNSDNLPIHKQRQVSAFPPNYVHSLDSSHMILTALEMDRRGLAFTAVHDSYWTHPCDVDEMNEVLRDSFIELYRRPLLEELKRTWELRYPDIVFPDLPETGDLDLNEVKKARYFFQ